MDASMTWTRKVLTSSSSSIPAGPSGHENPEVNIEFMRAQHRFLDDFCGKYPHRLKSMIGVNARYIEESVAGDRALESLHMGRRRVRQPAASTTLWTTPTCIRSGRR